MASLLPSPSRDRAASDQGPGHCTVTYGVVAARRPPLLTNSQQRTFRNPCCTRNADHVPAWHFTDCDAALLTEQARGVHGRCDPCSEREPGTGRLRREQALVPVHPQWQATTHHLGNMRRHCVLAPTKTRRQPAAGGNPREGDGARSWGLIRPSRRMFSAAPVRGLSSGASAFHRNPHQLTRVQHVPAGKSSPAAQRTGGHRRVATRKTTGDLATRRGAGDPERRAEWATVLRYGHLRSAPVVVDAGLRTGWEPPTLCASLSGSCFSGSSMGYRLSDDAHTRLQIVAVQNIATCSQFWSRTVRVMQSAVHMPKVTGPEGRERCR